MSDLFRAITERLRSFGKEKRSAPRYTTHLEEQLVVTILLSNIGRRKEHERVPMIAGFTRDISESGLGIVVGQLNIAGRSILKAERALVVRLGLPTGAIEMRAKAVRHAELEEAGSGKKYLIGMQIEEMSNRDRQAYMGYLKRLGSRLGAEHQ